MPMVPEGERVKILVVDPLYASTLSKRIANLRPEWDVITTDHDGAFFVVDRGVGVKRTIIQTRLEQQGLRGGALQERADEELKREKPPFDFLIARIGHGNSELEKIAGIILSRQLEGIPLAPKSALFAPRADLTDHKLLEHLKGIKSLVVPEHRLANDAELNKLLIDLVRKKR